MLGYLHDERGAKSSKRLIGVVGGFLLFAAFGSHVAVQLAVALLTKTTPPAPDSMMAGIIAGMVSVALGLTTADKLSPQARAEADITKARATAELRAIPEEDDK
jgi:hypothetical protein